MVIGGRDDFLPSGHLEQPVSKHAAEGQLSFRITNWSWQQDRSASSVPAHSLELLGFGNAAYTVSDIQGLQRVNLDLCFLDRYVIIINNV